MILVMSISMRNHAMFSVFVLMDFSCVRLCRDLNTELEMMKQLLKEIVNRITDNLLGKSTNGIETDRQSRGTQSETHSVNIRATLLLDFIRHLLLI